MSEKKIKKAPKLSGKQVCHLRGLGHHLSPALLLGREGISKTLLAAAEEAITAHELIKVKVQKNSPLDRREAGDKLATNLQAAIAQTLGNTILLYRENTDLKPDERIKLPV